MELNHELLTVAEVGAYLQVSNKRIYQLIQVGKIPAVKLPGGSYRIWRDELLATIKPAKG